MPRQTVTIIKATEKTIVMEGVIGRDYRLSIPKAVRNLISADTKIRVTIEKI